ncbi:hypothetical protein CAPTEDRAFT_218640 [Capitella teleta]|uniref:Transcription factor CBF/NF-Y/archaeal histone domain-containing protein n=1 Tax=Capitella teleta TaxID=283909 RepID=R7UNY3_CAPTE|nr:hypothetical protein CAPTEDRAFT_218640 [Capitella teleta]|eukprot:ELU05071.1 hypothetical protein CAPTEDRAFT_218640 [Capitella teleta]
MAGEEDRNSQDLIENEPDSAPAADDSEKSERVVKFPITRIKTIIKTDPDVTMASQDAVVLIGKATELFIQTLSKEAFSYTMQAKRKTVLKRDVDLTIDHIDALAFLEGCLDG